ncbi:MAG: OmpA family protein [Methylophilus sp.]|nr:OmpA family protein [Methylophilus sp.]
MPWRVHASLTQPSAIKQKGASLVEFIVVAPTLLMMILGVMQTGLVFHAKSNINYATFEAARAGTVGHGQASVIRDAFTRAMVGYYGGGRNLTEIAQATARAQADITPATMQVELLSPTKESFDDYASPQLASRLQVNHRVIPNSNLNAINCPLDRPNCSYNPSTNKSGQTLSDANLLKVRITYGIPPTKQVPLVGRLYVKVLQGLSGIQGESSSMLGLSQSVMSVADSDTFKQALLAQGRIPIVMHTTMRMQSEPFENGNVSSSGTGNNGAATPPEEVGGEDGPTTGNDTCPESDPNCHEQDAGEEIPCDAATDASCGAEPDPCLPDTTQESIQAEVLFAFNEYTLTAQGKAALDKLIQHINAHKNDAHRRDKLYITGHTDKIGNHADNLTLSEQRANAVYEYLLQGLDADVDIDMITKGAGETTPVTTNGTCTEVNSTANIANCAPDRRVTFTSVYDNFND